MAARRRKRLPELLDTRVAKLPWDLIASQQSLGPRQWPSQKSAAFCFGLACFASVEFVNGSEGQEAKNYDGKSGLVVVVFVMLVGSLSCWRRQAFSTLETFERLHFKTDHLGAV